MTEWTDDEVSQLLRLRENGLTVSECASSLNRPHDSVDHKLRRLSKSVNIGRAESHGKIVESALLPETKDTRDSYISTLESRIASLESKLVTQNLYSMRTGGTFTHRESDVHYADSNHLLSSCEHTWQKTLELIRLYQPDKIQLIWGDDYVAGRGIYKDQDLDVTVSDGESQCQIGAVHFRRRILSLREITSAPIHVEWLRGNHEYANGHPLAGELFLRVRDIVSDQEGISFCLSWDHAIINLAYDGFHNGLFVHGYGFSAISPNSPRFITDMKDKLLILHRSMPNDQQIRRIASGHTHQFSKGLERTVGISWDTTGGWQRNARVQLGFNQRPSGSIAYVSLPGMHGEILEPIGLQPNEDIYLREIEDSHLPSRNRTDSSECLIEYQDIWEERGLCRPKGEYGSLNSGRW